jgi:hypothetical protein
MADVSSIDGIAESSIEKVDLFAKASISNINGYTFPIASQDIDIEYDFNSQTTQENASSDWSPSGDAQHWVNGADAVDGTYWGLTSNKIVKGWNCGFGGTGSSGTGPNGGVDTSDGSHNTSERYLYSEASGRHTRCFVTRMPGSNFSTEMTDTSADLNLKFWVHAYGSNMGDLFVYIDTNESSNNDTATSLASYTSFSGYTANSSVWQQNTISLNSYRTVNATHFIYFITQNGTQFRSDLSIDSVIIEEG